MSENYQLKGYAKLAISVIVKWCFDDLKKNADGFMQPSMESDSYYYYRQI